jgi:hypothetical protein
MSNEKVSMKIQIACVLSGLMLFSGVASSESTRKPAVSQINGSLTGFYSGRFLSEFGYPFEPESEWNNTGGVAANAYLPVGSRLGLVVSGGGRWGGADDLTTSPFVTTTSRNLSEFFVGAGLFWRDPGSGYVGLFYDYDRSRIEYPGTVDFGNWFFPPESFEAVAESDQNNLRLAGGLYLREVDLSFDGGYERSCSSFAWFQPAANEICDDGFEFGAAVAGYPGESDRVRVGLGLRGGQFAAGESFGDLYGVAWVDWQPPVFGNRFVRLGGSLLGGGFIGSGTSVPFVTLGLSLSIDLPGANDLKQLFREMQI